MPSRREIWLFVYFHFHIIYYWHSFHSFSVIISFRPVAFWLYFSFYFYFSLTLATRFYDFPIAFKNYGHKMENFLIYRLPTRAFTMPYASCTMIFMLFSYEYWYISRYFLLYFHDTYVFLTLSLFRYTDMRYDFQHGFLKADYSFFHSIFIIGQG